MFKMQDMVWISQCSFLARLGFVTSDKFKLALEDPNSILHFYHYYIHNRGQDGIVQILKPENFHTCWC